VNRRGLTVVRHWFQITREWAQRRDARLRAEEDAIVMAARDEATGDERAFLDGILAERALKRTEPGRSQ
jgi:hypothetical protein